MKDQNEQKEQRNVGYEKTSRKRFKSNFLAGYNDRENNTTIEERRMRKNGTRRKRNLSTKDREREEETAIVRIKRIKRYAR